MKRTNGKITTFFRRNALYIVLAFCILAIGLSMTLVIVNKGSESISQEKPPVIDDGGIDAPPTNGDILDPGANDTPTDVPDDVPSEPVVSVISFIMPVETNSYSEYSETMVFNQTLGRFSTHTAMDFYAEEGASVYAVLDGEVESVEKTLLQGVTVVINHGDGLKTVYNSLADGDMVTVGQTVSQGDVIGAVSISNRQEYKDGAHLHFEVMENGVNVNPLTYLTIEEK